MKEEIYMKCQNCGMENADGARFCKGCGVELNQNNGGGVDNGLHLDTPPYSGDYTPISMWGYFGYELLFSIPCIGFILLLVFSFGGTKNVNLRNFARSYFCFMIILLVLVGILMLTGATAGLFSTRYYY